MRVVSAGLCVTHRSSSSSVSCARIITPFTTSVGVPVISAATQFAALYEQFNKNAEGLTAALEGIGSLLGHAGQSYAAVEEQIAASFRG